MKMFTAETKIAEVALRKTKTRIPFGTGAFSNCVGVRNREPGHILCKPPSGGFPEGLIDRAFTPGSRATDLQSPFSTGLKWKALAPGRTASINSANFLKHAEAR